MVKQFTAVSGLRVIGRARQVRHAVLTEGNCDRLPPNLASSAPGRTLGRIDHISLMNL